MSPEAPRLEAKDHSKDHNGRGREKGDDKRHYQKPKTKRQIKIEKNGRGC